MSKAESSHGGARIHAGRAGVGLALAATTAVGVAVPAAQAHTVPRAAPRAVAPAVRAAAVPQMTYRVQAGDTVSHIALRTGSSISSIIAVNALDTRGFIRAGQMLKVPSAAGAPAAVAPAVAAPAAATHTAVKGETVTRIAARYGTTVRALVDTNALPSADRIAIGQVLRLPGAAMPAPTTPAATTAAAPAPVAGTRHAVSRGETVSGIAARYGTTVRAIIDANGLGANALIFAGQTLTIPAAGASAPAAVVPVRAPAAVVPVSAPAPAAATYTVLRGDTVSHLAKAWGTTIAAVIEANSLDGAGLIYVGQQLKVPGVATPAPATASKPLVPNTFLGRTYPAATVAAANANKAALLAAGVPSRQQMQATVVEVARAMGVDPVLAQAHAYQESGFNHASVSPANAIGTMQVIPSSGRWASDLVGRQLDLLDPYDNVVAGVAIIRQLHRTSPDFDSAIAGYYQGAGSVSRNGMFSDTKSYVASVKAHMGRF
ncbi:MAG: lytic transglycosylase [Georgenia sp.]